LAGQRLATKLYLPPARQTLVGRPRLIEQLNEGLKGRLTLISAPAGFGKTSLVTAWRQQSETPLAWVSLDEGDNEPARFLDYLLGALQTVEQSLARETSGLLQAATSPPLKAVLTSLLYEVNESEAEFVLAFDDYHVITEQGIHEALSFLIVRRRGRGDVKTSPRVPQAEREALGGGKAGASELRLKTQRSVRGGRPR
jgi:LuxR family maltose regulon positive regulatory protein